MSELMFRPYTVSHKKCRVTFIFKVIMFIKCRPSFNRTLECYDRFFAAVSNREDIESFQELVLSQESQPSTY